MVDVLKKIEKIRELKKWSEYKLSTKSGISQSTINSWYQKNQIPSLRSLEKICNALDITLSVLLAENDNFVELTNKDWEILYLIEALNDDQKEALLAFLKTLTQK